MAKDPEWTLKIREAEHLERRAQWLQMRARQLRCQGQIRGQAPFRCEMDAGHAEPCRPIKWSEVTE